MQMYINILSTEYLICQLKEKKDFKTVLSSENFYIIIYEIILEQLEV